MDELVANQRNEKTNCYKEQLKEASNGRDHPLGRKEIGMTLFPLNGPQN